MLDRRRFLAAAGSLAAGAAVPVQGAPAAPMLPGGRDAAHYGVRPGTADDQSRALQKAIDQTAAAQTALLLAPGIYRCAELKLPAGAALIGARGATRLVLSRAGPLMEADGADGLSLIGLMLDGDGIAAPNARGLVRLRDGRSLRVADCDFGRAGGNALTLERIGGTVMQSAFTGAGDVGLFALDSRGLTITGNAVSGCGNGAIHVWQSTKRDDGTIIADNRIEDIAARAGGSGQNGNAINVYRAANVIVRGNRIRNVAFSAVRGNAASNIQITGNTCTALGEVALYAEFDFEGAVIAANTVDGAAVGIAVTNFDKGGRLAVVQGNLIRNLINRRPPGTDPADSAGVGIGVEADTAVTGNVIENAPTAGIAVGWGPYLRDVTISGNIVRETGFGITVSVSPGAGHAAITGNMIAGAKRGAIVGMDRRRVAIADLTANPAATPQVSMSANRIR
jgi:uncharacterized secreted repeat protein (TIGR03808 family)